MTNPETPAVKDPMELIREHRARDRRRKQKAQAASTVARMEKRRRGPPVLSELDDLGYLRAMLRRVLPPEFPLVVRGDPDFRPRFEIEIGSGNGVVFGRMALVDLKRIRLLPRDTQFEQFREFIRGYM